MALMLVYGKHFTNLFLKDRWTNFNEAMSHLDQQRLFETVKLYLLNGQVKFGHIAF